MINVKRRESKLKQDFSQINLSPMLQKIYQNRGIDPVASLEKNLSKLYPFELMLNVDKAAARLYQAIIKQEKILIIGDFDSDGATSTAVAISALEMFGAQHVAYLVPNRFDFGYGLSPEIVD